MPKDIMTKSLRHIIVITLFCACTLIYLLFAPVVMQLQGVTFLVRPGMSRQQFISQLEQQNIVSFPRTLFLYAAPPRMLPLKAGEYLFSDGASLFSIWRQVSTGTGLIYYQFTIIPGWTFVQLRQELNKTPQLRHFTANLTDQQIMAYLGAGTVAAEGQFFPETYNYARDTNDLVILKRAYDLMQTRFDDAWKARMPGLFYQKPYDALIAASLIEKEAYLNAERPIISGVLINRLKQNMLLQIDPTVIYGLGQRYDGKIYRKDLQENTPYNTYVHKGLPPTPIAMPGMVSIDAALHPAQHDYLYFVAKGNGSHQFSQTLTEHHVAVQAAMQTPVPAKSMFNAAVVRSYLEETIRR